MLEKFEAALRVDEWPDIAVPPRVLDFLKSGAVDLPRGIPDRRSLQAHYALKKLVQTLEEDLDQCADQTFVHEIGGFTAAVKRTLYERVAAIKWPEGWIQPEQEPSDANVVSQVKRNIDLGLTIVTNLYLGVLHACSDVDEINYRLIEKATLKASRRIMQLDDESGIVTSVEKIFGAYDQDPSGIFELHNGEVDISDRTKKQLGVVMAYEPDILNLLALERCPAFHHTIINQFVRYLTLKATQQRGVVDRVNEALRSQA